MSYYLSTTIAGTFEQAVEKVRAALKTEGFGVLTEIDLRAALRKKLGKDFRPYTILGACNPPFAWKALSLEDKIGTMLPCNVVIQQREDGQIEVAAIDPVTAMQAVENPALREVAEAIRARLQNVLAALS